ncbi:MAG TPA: hypothetical protein VGB75_11120 [Jatrophihabitans sp.]|jgi:hypothetical protein|uniref:hypothetical protein n=1 Tax=Jatrophihabitans sp. TaxID=1932789 RepID=UPI002EFC9749
MQGWIVAGAWGFAVLLAVVVLGFASYEISWKSRRLVAERARLEQQMAELTRLGAQLQAAADRLR